MQAAHDDNEEALRAAGLLTIEVSSAARLPETGDTRLLCTVRLGDFACTLDAPGERLFACEGLTFRADHPVEPVIELHRPGMRHRAVARYAVQPTLNQDVTVSWVRVIWTLEPYGPEEILAILAGVRFAPAGILERLRYELRNLFAPRIGHLILTSERLAFIRFHRSREGPSPASPPYSLEDLRVDLAEPANLQIPLYDIADIEVSDEEPAVLHVLERRATARGSRDRRFSAVARPAAGGQREVSQRWRASAEGLVQAFAAARAGTV